MCTASHNPKAYTGAKLVRAGRDRASGDEGIDDIRRADRGGPRRRRRRRRHRSRRSTSTPSSTRRRCASIDPRERQAAEGRRRRRQRDGRADGRPAARAPRRSSSSRPTGSPTASSPTTSPTRCSRRTAASSSTRCARRAPTSASPGTATPTAASSSTTPARFVDGDFLTALLGRVAAAQAARAPTILYDVRASRAVPDTVERAGGTRATSTASATRSSRRRMRDEGAIFGGEVSGHYYFHDFYNADSGTIPALLDARAAVASRASALSELLEPYRSTLLHLRRDQLRGRRRARRRWPRSSERYARRRAISHLDGVSVDYDDWHFNVRPSNTEPLLRLCLESLVSRRRTWSAGATRCSG